MAIDAKYAELLEKTINDNLVRVVLSKPAGKENTSFKCRPIIVKDKLLFQLRRSIGNKESNTVKEVFKNLTSEELKKILESEFPTNFKNALIETKNEGYTLLSSKKGSITIIRNKSVNSKEVNLSHNKEKNYIINEGDNAPFLKDLGVFTADGKIVKARYDKFRQINRYLEFINDVVDRLSEETDKEITVIDFGCGKSYLTFATYYFLKVVKKLNVRVIGLDLKTDVINECNKLRNKYGYEKLEFIEGDIQSFEGVSSVDLVISLHACDTATDYALYKAMKWDAKVIMAVPCCQHELNKTIDIAPLKALTSYGLLKERLASLLTDAQRANVLTENGYETQILEFIDMEHTPKNILIRAVKSNKAISKSKKQSIDAFDEFLNNKLTLNKLMEENSNL